MRSTDKYVYVHMRGVMSNKTIKILLRIDGHRVLRHQPISYIQSPALRPASWPANRPPLPGVPGTQLIAREHESVWDASEWVSVGLHFHERPKKKTIMHDH